MIPMIVGVIGVPPIIATGAHSCRKFASWTGIVQDRSWSPASTNIELNEAVRLDPNYSEAHTSLGILLARQGKMNDAIAHFSEALRINSDNHTARTWLAELTGKDPATR
jgi:hypothetical protein